jgi:hypothetical protein
LGEKKFSGLSYTTEDMLKAPLPVVRLNSISLGVETYRVEVVAGIVSDTLSSTLKGSAVDLPFTE